MGDDIGLEIVPAAVKVLKDAVKKYREIVIDWCELPIGHLSYIDSGETLPRETLERLSALDGWILGPIGHAAYPKDDEKAINPHPVIRRQFDLVSNIRPAKSYPAIPSLHKNVDMVIIRENNEGFPPDRNMYKGMADFMPTPDIALSVRVITKRNSEFVARTAFELARRRKGQRKVTAVHKNTVHKLCCGLFFDTCREVAADYPDITFESIFVDTFAMHLAMKPQVFDVVVTTSLFGDILSDEAAGLVGGLGMAPGLSAGPEYAMAQATHGSAPDIAGRHVANPYSMVVSAQMLLAWLGERKGDDAALQAAQDIEEGVDEVINEGVVKTPDLGGEATTEEMCDAICHKIVDMQRRIQK
ncbi:MAG: isocitrate/isopropylmalate dehydrogenase family protein [Deltaproteobacteria bacterium]|nr:isocitrate/isopropylmalate dehydrogenase family protein [Deltaproteobacteria bacterium]